MWLQKLKSLSVLYFLVDLIITGGVWLASYGIRFELLIPWKDVPPFLFHLKLTPFVVLMTLGVFYLQKLYHPKILFQLKRAFQLYGVGMVLAMALVIALTYFYNQLNYSRGVLLIYAVGCLLSLILVRLCLRTVFLNRFKTLRFIRRAFLVGNNKSTLEAVLKNVQSSPEFALQVQGYFAHQDLGMSNISYLGRRLTVEACKANQVKTVLFCPHWEEISGMEDTIKILARELYDLHLVLDISFLHFFNYSIDEFAHRPMLNLNDHSIQGLNFMMKRLFDIGFSLGVLGLGIPIFLIIAGLIKLTSRGPVFYYQKRTGFDGKEFWMPKFRTMVVNSEDTTGPIWATRDDPRVTSIGRILRRTSLDELPQFLSVFRGHMSVVGPRPERPEFLAAFSEKFPVYGLRNKVKAGITGWAQINGLRGDTSLKDRLEYDLHYIKNWSILFDFRIILETLVKGLFNKNAY